MMSAEVYYTLEEVAEQLKLHATAVRLWIRRGKLPAVQVGNRFLVRREDVERASRSTLESDQEGLLEPAAELQDFDHLALASLVDLWDNDEDAIYDNWRELYGVAER